jgi:hypothetical protein
MELSVDGQDEHRGQDAIISFTGIVGNTPFC